MKIPIVASIEEWFRSHRNKSIRTLLNNPGSQFLEKNFNEHVGARGDLILRNLIDHRIVVDPCDQGISREIIRSGDWQRNELETAISFLSENKFLRPNSVFADIGANIGTQTIYAMLSGKFSGAIAVEPAPHNVDLLKLNVLINNMADKVVIIQVAAGGDLISVELSLFANNNGRHSIRFHNEKGEKLLVNMMPLDTTIDHQGIASNKIGFVWIDTEGAEPDVLRGMTNVLSHAPPLVIEWNSELYSPQEINAMIATMTEKYESCIDLRPIAANKAPPLRRPIASLSGIVGQADVLCIPSC